MIYKKWAKDLNRHLAKENIQLANKHMKRYFTSYVIRVLQVQTTMEWPKSRTLTTPNAGENVEQQELSFIAVGNQNGSATLLFFL